MSVDAHIQPSPPTHTHIHGCFMRRNIFGYSLNTRAFFFWWWYLIKQTNKPLEKEKDTFRGGGFPDSLVGKKSTCNAGDPGWISGSERSGEGIGYPLQYSWASLVAQLVENPPAMWETWVRSLGGEDPLEKGKATLSSILAWRIPWIVQSMASQRVGQD